LFENYKIEEQKIKINQVKYMSFRVQ